MCEIILALDAGGSSIKAGVIRGDEVLATQAFPFPNDRRETLETAFAAATAWGKALGATHMGVCCPGPFDFDQGISRMTHKWRGLQDVPLTPLLCRGMPWKQVTFLHDSTAFLLGEAWQGAARGMDSPAGVMLGTGFGFAVMHHRRVLVQPGGSPRYILWNAPLDGGTVEDVLSRRALRAAYGPDAPDVKELADLAHQGDERAAVVFRQAGEKLGEVLTRYLPPFVEVVVLGGQIARAKDLLLPWVQAPVPVVPAQHLGDAALRGIAVYCRMEATKEACP